MQIAHITGQFPQRSQTFITNQFIGLLNKGHSLKVFANCGTNTSTSDELMGGYDVDELSVYSARPNTPIDALRMMARVTPDLLREGAPLTSILTQFRHGKSALDRIRRARDLSLNGNRVEVIHAHFGQFGNSCLFAQELLRKPLVVSFYGFDISRLPRSNPSMYSELFNKCRALVCLSDDMKEDLVELGCPNDKIVKIPLSVDIEKFQYRERGLSPTGPLKLLTVARLVEKKGVEYAIKAVAQLDLSRPIDYIIAGDGPRRDKLESLITDVGADDEINILGWQSHEEIANLMSDAHLFLLPSVLAENGDKEGTPTAILEAQASGLPVVSTYHAGIPEIVNDMQTGILVPERDVAKLQEALETIVEISDKWPEMGRKGRQFIETHHSIQAISNDLETLYGSLVSDGANYRANDPSTL